MEDIGKPKTEAAYIRRTFTQCCQTQMDLCDGNNTKYKARTTSECSFEVFFTPALKQTISKRLRNVLGASVKNERSQSPKCATFSTRLISKLPQAYSNTSKKRRTSG